MIAFFFAGWPVAQVALVAGALLLITRRVEPEAVYREIDWSLLVMFIGLFIVIAGVEKTALAAGFFGFAARFGLGRVGVLSAASAVLSNIVSNVPAVLIFKPLIPHLANPRQAWLVLAMSSTLAGNLTVLGSVANLIVVERARRQVRIGFWEYSRLALRWRWPRLRWVRWRCGKAPPAPRRNMLESSWLCAACCYPCPAGRDCAAGWRRRRLPGGLPSASSPA
jgi:Na+/H+ antiporter NhaD/arsenite permease-like protein